MSSSRGFRIASMPCVSMFGTPTRATHKIALSVERRAGCLSLNVKNTHPRILFLEALPSELHD